MVIWLAFVEGQSVGTLTIQFFEKEKKKKEHQALLTTHLQLSSRPKATRVGR